MQTPTTASIKDQIVSQLEAELSSTVPLLPKAFSRVLAAALAGVFVLLWKYAGSIFLNLFVAHASFRPTLINGKVVRPLVAWGRLAGVSDPIEATQGEFTIELTVTNQTGSLPAHTQLIKGDIVYLTTADVALDAATKSVNVRPSLAGAGTPGNLLVGDVLRFASPQANVAKPAPVTAIVTEGEDGETEASYRSRVVEHFRSVPKGGGAFHFREWGESVAGVSRVFPYGPPVTFPGTVDLYVEADTSIDPDGIPTTGLLDNVRDYINETDPTTGLAIRRPANCGVRILPITRTALGVTIIGFRVPEKAQTTKDAIKAALQEYFLTRGPYIPGVTAPGVDRATPGAVAGIVDTVVSASGGTVTDVEFSLYPSEGGLTGGELLKLDGDPAYL